MTQKDETGGVRAQTTDARRRLLIETAVMCFVENGIAGTGVRDIANRAGVSLGNLYNHFKGKNALIAEIARLETEELRALVDKTDAINDGQKALTVFADGLLEQTTDLINAVLTVEITAMALRDPEIATLFEGNHRMQVKCLSDVIRRGKTQGDVSRDVPEEETAELLLDLIGSFGVRIGLSERKITRKERQAIRRMLAQTLSG